MLAPIALFCYKRLDVLIETVEALKKNELSSKSDIIIFSDGYKTEDDKSDVEAVREYLKSIEGFNSKKIIEAPKNRGLANSIIAGVSEVVEKYGKVIVIEDDILTSPYFLNYMNDALDMYEKDDEVACISGYTYPIKTKEQSFFIKKGECWGWATWKRAWEIFEPDGQTLLDMLKSKNLTKEFDYDDSYPFTQMLQDQIDKKNDSWAIRWSASVFLKNKLCLQLGKPVAKNIGFGVKGSTHCVNGESAYNVNLNKGRIKLEKIPIKESEILRNKFAMFFKRMTGKISGNFLLSKEKKDNLRIITLLGIFKIKYNKNREV